jgi:hypothetical protein
VICFRWISSPPTMGIGTSSYSGGARGRAPLRIAYAINRDASELGRSRSTRPPTSAPRPDACHLKPKTPADQARNPYRHGPLNHARIWWLILTVTSLGFRPAPVAAPAGSGPALSPSRFALRGCRRFRRARSAAIAGFPWLL